MSRFDGVGVTWLGHATFRLTSPDGTVILIDPWLENPKAPENAGNISKVDVIALTHGHFDHFGNTVEIAQKTGAKVISIFEISQYLSTQGLAEDQVIGMNIGGTVAVDGVNFTMTAAIHSSGITGDSGIVDGGDPAGFVIRFQNGFTVYHTGDTDLFGDMKYIGEIHHPDLMLTCIGDHFTMGPRAAAESINLIQPKYVVPMHYGTFPLLTGTPEALEKALPDAFKESVITAQPGVELN